MPEIFDMISKAAKECYASVKIKYSFKKCSRLAIFIWGEPDFILFSQGDRGLQSSEEL